VAAFSTPQFLSRVGERAGLEAPAAGALAQAAFEALGRQLSDAGAHELAGELPPTLAEWVLDAEHGSERGAAALLDAVMRNEAASRAFAVEHAMAVCQVLAESLGPAALRALTGALDDDVGPLLQPREPRRAFQPVRVDRRHRTLAEADAASARPLFRSGPPDAAHSESIARAENPHAETKLSTSRGLTQEREERTLATGGRRR